MLKIVIFLIILAFNFQPMQLKLFALFLCIASLSYGQNNSEKPYSFSNYVLGVDNTPIYQTTPLNIEALHEEDLQKQGTGSPRVGVVIPVNINMTNSGIWLDLPNGDKIWRLTLTVPNALAVNLYFDDFFLPFGGKLHAFTPNHHQIASSYNVNDNPESGYYATDYVNGETIVLEYYEPLATSGLGRLNIEGINGFYHMVAPFESREDSDERAGPCQVDVNCSEGDNWREQIDATVRVLIKHNNETSWCSGVLLNNTAEDCTPYILSAHHCATYGPNNTGTSAAEFQEWVFYFNYQKSGCGTGFTSGFYTEVGAVKKANSHTNGGILGSDYLLLELNDDLDESRTPYFAGWDANNVASTSGVGVHHPSGDPKKISTYLSAATSSSWTTSPAGTHWRVFWFATANGHGVNEGGSSGSGMFNDEGLVVGQLSGGLSECNDTQPDGQNQPDLYGKMSYNWNGGSNIQSLKTFLDPINNGGTKVMGGNYYLCSLGSGIINSVEENGFNYDISVYPNPFESEISIDLFDLENVEVEIYNTVGALVFNAGKQSNKFNVNLVGLESGVYYIKLTKNGVSRAEKLVKI